MYANRLNVTKPLPPATCGRWRNTLKDTRKTYPAKFNSSSRQSTQFSISIMNTPKKGNNYSSKEIKERINHMRNSQKFVWILN